MSLTTAALSRPNTGCTRPGGSRATSPASHVLRTTRGPRYRDARLPYRELRPLTLTDPRVAVLSFSIKYYMNTSWGLFVIYFWEHVHSKISECECICRASGDYMFFLGTCSLCVCRSIEFGFVCLCLPNKVFVVEDINGDKLFFLVSTDDWKYILTCTVVNNVFCIFRTVMKWNQHAKKSDLAVINLWTLS